MKQETIKYLQDILDSINAIESYLGPKRNFLEFESNSLLQDAIIRRMEIIGEATNRIFKSEPEVKIEDASKIVALRNRIAHEYDSLTLEYIWSIVINNLPKLKTEVEALLNNE